MNAKPKLLALVALAGLSGLSGGVLLSRGIADHQPLPALPKELTSYRDVVKRTLPAVVSVRVVAAKTTQVRGDRRLPEGALPNMPNAPEGIREFLEEQFNRQGEGQGEGNVRPGAFGSGVIIDPKGVVLTNNHVVAGASTVQVVMQDGRMFTSKNIATDPKTDLAVVKFETKEALPFLEFGDSEAMEIGDRVLAIGAPFGLEGSVSSGIVSGKGRSAGMLFYEDYIQTDAAINPGNSGGPLVSLEGRIVGICNSIRTSTGGSQGVGMAIPSRIAKDVARQLAKNGAVLRGYLGIRFGEVNPDVAAKLGFDGKGAVVGQVQPDGPAGKAGLKEGDVIVSLDGKPLKQSKDLQRTVASADIGQELKLGVFRDGKTEALTVKIEAQPAEYGLRDLPVRGGGGRRQPNRQADQPEALKVEKLGLEATELTPEARERLGFAKGAAGVMVWNVDRGSPAFQAGLRRGMVIASVDKKEVKTLDELEKAAEKADLKAGVLLLIKSPQGSEYVVVKKDSE